MSRPLRVLLLMALTLVAGCFPALYTDAPLGEPARWDASEWNGLWLFDLPENGKLVRLHVSVPGINGLATTDNWRECDISQAGPWDDASLGKLRRHGEWYFEDSCEGRLATGQPCEYLAILRRDGEVLTGHLADEEHVRRLLDEKKVAGRIELLPSDGSPKQRVVLNPQTDEHYKELLNPLTGAFPFSVVFGVRLPAELDPCSKQAK